jgi:hypothetical protein
VVQGYARLELARRQGRQTILCLEYDLTDEEALRWLIQSHRPSRGLNSYSRVLLALDLEPSLQERARANQQAGGQSKGSSHLTEAHRRETAHPRVELAVRSGEISIHKGWQWSRFSPEQQSHHLEEYRNRKGTNQTSRRLIEKHVAKRSPTQLFPATLGSLLKTIVPDRSAALDSIVVTEVDAPGNIAYLTKDALSNLRSIEESKCPA